MATATLQLPSPRKPRNRAQNVEPILPGPLPVPERSSIQFSPPVRRILTPDDLLIFQGTPTYSLLTNFILSLNDAIMDKPLSYGLGEVDEIIQKIRRVLQRVEQVVDENPRVESDSRFGNEGFRSFHDALSEKLKTVHQEMNIHLEDGAIEELSVYLNESFGNRTRIDYGSGHELNFISWLLCLQQLNCFSSSSSYTALATLIFPQYIRLMRHIQELYYLEPAGSHGVWGLDDYQFLPFLLGSAQLFHHTHLRPMSIHNDEILEEFGNEYMYLDCIRFINSIKTTAGLRWHSPMLDDISSAKNWGKINVGMCKMWEKEVLGKLPIMQHFMFGGILPAVEAMGKAEREEREMVELMEGLMDANEGDGPIAGKSAEEIEALKVKLDREGMRHVHSTWGECCGIKVPSAVAAREAGNKGNLRSVGRIPFD